jgi:O-antigen/teichoic acid export membrane protein
VLPGNTFGQSAAKLVGGTALAQLITVAAAPILTRIYEPAAYGTFAILVGIASTLAVISSLSYEVSIVIIRGRRLAVNAVFLCLSMLGVSVAMTILVVLTFAPIISGWLFDGSASSALLFVLPLLLAAMGFNQIICSAALRERAFNAISTVRIVQASTTVVSQAALFPASGFGLVGGMIIGQVIGARHLWRSAFPQGTSCCVSLRNMSRAMRHLRRFPLLELPFSVLNSAGNYLPPVLLAIFFGTVVGGIFALALRVLSAPVSLVSSAMGQVFFASATQANRDGNLGALVAQVHSNLSRLVLPALVLIAFGGPDLFELTFGEKWRDAGKIAALMTPWIFMQALGSTVSTIWIVQGNLHHGMIFGLVGFLMRCTALLSAYWIEDWMLAVGIFSITNSIYYLAVSIYAILISKSSLSSFGLVILKNVLLSLLFSIPTAIGVMSGSMTLTLAGLAMSTIILLIYNYRSAKEF